MIRKALSRILNSAAARQRNSMEHRSAVRIFEKVLKLNRGDERAWLDLIESYLSSGEEEKALVTVERAKARFPNSYRLHLSAAEMYLKKNDSLNALGNFIRAYEVENSNELARTLSDLIGTSTDFALIFPFLAKYFDSDFYLSNYPDVQAAKLNPIYHYLLYGWKEGRTTSAAFSSDILMEMELDGKMVGDDFPLVTYHQRINEYKGGDAPDDTWLATDLPDEEMWRDLAPARITSATEAVVIIPIYKGYQESLLSIYQALHSQGKRKYALLVINDCSPDVVLSNRLGDLAAANLFEYVINENNLGFVRTVNRAIKDHSGEFDVVLLNSDAFVFPGWFDRMFEHTLDPSVATVTPLTNNGTICSYPLMNFENSRPLELLPHKLDELTSEVNRGRSVDAPTGVGFCFFMKRKVINEIGPLDEATFKLGYGEECDFCFRALNAGYSNKLAVDIFVYHIGSVSFSSIKEVNFIAGQTALEKKHANYSLLVRQHIQANPALSARQRIDTARIALQNRRPVIFISHAWGGGIKKFLEGEKARLEKSNIPYLEMRVENLRFISIVARSGGLPFTPNLRNIDISLQCDLISNVLAAANPRVIHVNSFAGLDWYHHKSLLELIVKSGLPYSYMCHDYSCFSPNFQLVRPDGIYCGIPNVEQRKAWATMTMGGITDLCDPAERKTTYLNFFRYAQAIEVPSRAASQIIEREFPEIDFTLKEHADILLPNSPRPRRRGDGRLRIAAVGAIGMHKGSQIILALARDASNRNLPIEFSIVGFSDVDMELISAGVQVSGKYRTDQHAIEVINKIEPDFIFIPSIWPETYCYALSFAFHLGIRAITFDLGAQAERNAARGDGVILEESIINSPQKINDRLCTLVHRAI